MLENSNIYEKNRVNTKKLWKSLNIFKYSGKYLKE